MVLALLFSAGVLNAQEQGEAESVAETEIFAAPSSPQHRLRNFLETTQEQDDWTRLMLATLQSSEAVEEVLRQGVQVNVRGHGSFQGTTPLIFAARIGQLETVRVLVEHRARINDTDRAGMTALAHAAQEG